jgi:hypothetical protein
VNWRMRSSGRNLRPRARVSKYAGNRDHRHTWCFDGTAGSGVGAKSLDRDHRTRALRREPFCFVLLSRTANRLISLVGRCLVKSSAIYKALIEPVLGRLADFDFFEIRMPGI